MTKIYTINKVKTYLNHDIKQVKIDNKIYYVCNVCGRLMSKKISANKKVWCNKHYKQLKKYGKPIDINPRTILDKNEINVVGDVAYINIYNDKCDVIAITTINADDVEDSASGETASNVLEDPLLSYLSNITLVSTSELDEDGSSSTECDAVNMMTIHSSKGLEFKHVFLVGFENTILPSQRSVDIGSDKSISEERRLAYVGITRAKEYLFLTCSKQRTIFGSTSCNQVSRFLREIPSDLLDGYDKALGEKQESNNLFGDSKYSWTYGSKDNRTTNNGAIKTYKIDSKEPAVAASASSNNGFMFRTAESFLNSLNKKSSGNDVDLSKYKSGVRIFHKKFGEGTISNTEPEGDDLKVDIQFDKVGHERLMAKFANLEVIE